MGKEEKKDPHKITFKFATPNLSSPPLSTTLLNSYYLPVNHQKNSLDINLSLCLSSYNPLSLSRISIDKGILSFSSFSLFFSPVELILICLSYFLQNFPTFLPHCTTYLISSTHPSMPLN
jgi:hypothetical protein